MLSVAQRVGKEPQTSVPPQIHEHIGGRKDFDHFSLAPGSADCDMSRTRHDYGANPDDHVNIPVDVSSTRPSVGVRQKEDRHRECGSWSRSTDECHVVEQVDASRFVSRSAPFPADLKFMLKKPVALSSDGTETSLKIERSFSCSIFCCTSLLINKSVVQRPTNHRYSVLYFRPPMCHPAVTSL